MKNILTIKGPMLALILVACTLLASCVSPVCGIIVDIVSIVYIVFIYTAAWIMKKKYESHESNGIS